jgi:hypothetical protein
MFSFQRFRKTYLVLILMGAGFFSGPVQAQQAPAPLQAALIMKILSFYTNLGADPFSIHVVGAPDVAAELKKHVGKPAGKATLNDVTVGDSPDGGAKVVYVGSNVAGTIAYTQEKQVLSVTGNPEFVSQGVTLGITIEDKKPKILLNLTSSKNEGINWNPSILKVAATIK